MRSAITRSNTSVAHISAKRRRYPSSQLQIRDWTGVGGCDVGAVRLVGAQYMLFAAPPRTRILFLCVARDRRWRSKGCALGTPRHKACSPWPPLSANASPTAVPIYAIYVYMERIMRLKYIETIYGWCAASKERPSAIYCWAHILYTNQMPKTDGECDKYVKFYS